MINKVILMGRLTADPNFSQTQNGVAHCRFTVAVDRNFTDKSSGERQSDFISGVAWRQTAEFINKYFSKGKMICVEGTLRTGSYNDKNHPDVKHYTTDVQIENAYFTGEKTVNNNNNSYPVPQNNYSQNNSAPQNNAPAQNFNSAPADNTGMSVGNLSDFEEVLGENDLPF